MAIQSDVALTAEDAEIIEPDCHPHLRLQRMDQGLRAEMVVLPLGSQSQRVSPPGSATRIWSNSSQAGPFRPAGSSRTKPSGPPGLWRRSTCSMTTVITSGSSTIPRWPWNSWKRLQAVPAETLIVEWPKGDPITVRSLSSQQFRLSIHSAQDWFEVEGEVQVDENLMIQMRTLLDEIEGSDKRFIALGKDQYIALTRQLRKQLQWLATGGQFAGKGNGLRIHPLAAIGLEQWKDEIGEFQTDAKFDAHIDTIRAIESYHPALPSTLQATLRPYQEDGFTWLARLAEWGVGACLADDMGLGKTIEALALILHRASQGPTLVAAPTSVCANWVCEAAAVRPDPAPDPLRHRRPWPARATCSRPSGRSTW